MSIMETTAPETYLPEGFLDALAGVCGAGTLILDPDAQAKFLIEERSLFKSRAGAIVAPADAEELSRIVAICAERNVPVVPQGGNTGLVAGAVAAGHEVLVSLSRMNRILQIDAENQTMTVEAGAILADIQKAAAEAGCFFPLSLGAEGSCNIGGNIATNAGGINVLKYGNTRDLVLGLEAVLPDGRLWNGLRPLHKDNTGYALKHLFIGSEGSLGVVTRAVLKLYPAINQRQTAFCAIPSPTAALALLALARKRSGNDVTAFELMSRVALDLVTTHTDADDPFAEPHPWYALIELSTSRSGDDLLPLFEAFAEEAMDQGLILDAVVAQSVAQQQRLIALRETIPEAQKKAGGSIKHDVSVPVSLVPALIERGTRAVLDRMPEARVCAFGHVGDGNVHFNVSQPVGADRTAFMARWDEINAAVFAEVMQLGGSISAEHGIGKLKVHEIEDYRDPLESEMLRAVKRAFDPKNLMNPGKTIAL